MQIGSHRVTFDPNRANDNGNGYANPVFSAANATVFWLDGAPVTLGGANSVLTLDGGTVTMVSPTEYRVVLNTGEVVTVDPFGDGMGMTVALAPDAAPGSVEGFLGSYAGAAKSFILPDGTVLGKNLTQTQLYQTFANAWRVTDSSSLFDYAAGQTTQTFTDPQYPRTILTLADFPADLVAAAEAVVRAAGITDPTLIKNAAFDYITMGDPSFITEDATVAGLAPGVLAGSTSATIAPPVVPEPSIGIMAVAPAVTETIGGTTYVMFNVELTSATTVDTVVNYAAIPGAGVPNGKTYFSAADFGSVMPFGTVTIAAGETSTVATFALSATALGSATDKWLMVKIDSPAGAPLYDPTAQADVVNAAPVAGPAAIAQIQLLADTATQPSEFQPALTRDGDAFTLNLGLVAAGAVIDPLDFAIANGASIGSDSLAATLLTGSGTGFYVYGTSGLGTILAGSAVHPLELVAATAKPGVNSQTFTLVASDVNATGYAASLANLTLTVTDTVVAVANGLLNTGTVILPNVRVGANDTQALSVTNSATGNAAALDTSVQAYGAATAAGTIVALAAGATDTSDLIVGINTGAAGSISGSVTVGFASDLGNGVTVPVTPLRTVAVSGLVYREAAAGVSVPQPIRHVGGSGTVPVIVTNIAAADGYSEDLIASLTNASGAVTLDGTQATGDIVPGGTDSTSLTLILPTATAGIVSGTVKLNLLSDGTGIDGLGTIALPPQTIAVTETIDNYATAALVDLSATGPALVQRGDAYSLDFGVVAPHSVPATIKLAVENAATGTADLLAGSFVAGGTSPIGLSGFKGFDALASQQSQEGLDIQLNTGSAGVFTQQVTLFGTGYNVGGYAGTLAPEVLTITGTVVQSAEAAVPGSLNFGIVHVGDSVVGTVAVTNIATGALADLLTGSVAAISAGPFQSSASLGGGVAAGGVGTLVIGFDGAQAGTFAGEATLALFSRDASLGDNAIGTDTVALLGTVNAYATADVSFAPLTPLPELVATPGGLTFNDVPAGTAPEAVAVRVANSATGPADVLSGTFTVSGSSAFINSGFAGFSGLTDTAVSLAGTADLPGISAGTITLAPDVAPGVYTETIQEDFTGGNASGYAGTVLDQTITVTATVTTGTLTAAPTTIFGGSGNETIVAASGVLFAGDAIQPSGTGNVLVLEGAGLFDLMAPAVLSGVQTVTLDGAPAGRSQLVWLRNGLDATVTVDDAANVTIFGAVGDNSTIDLGAGVSVVHIGGAGETVTGGSGNDTVYVTAASIGASITGGSGTNWLEVTGGGTLTMGGGITGIQAAFLDNAASYDFTANATAGLTVFAGSGSDTITVGDASQTVKGSTGALTVQATAADAGAKVVGGSGGATLEITTAGTVVLNGGDGNLTVDLAAGDTLTLPFNTSIAVTGGGGDTLVATTGILRAGQTIAPGGSSNTLVLQGAGLFNLAAPTVLSGIQTVDLQGAAAGQGQIVWLRDGLDLTLNVQDGAAVKVFGAANNDIINLGSGNAIVYLGSAGETVTGGSGNEAFYVTAASIGASITGGSGTNWLEVTGGGTLTMGGGITGIQAAFLDNAASYDFTANATAGLTVFAGSGSDTITVGDASQTVKGSTGALTVQATAADAGAKVVGGSGGATLEITTAGTVVLNGGDGNLTVDLAAGDTLTLPFNTSIAVTGGGGDTLVATTGILRAGQTIAPGGSSNTLVLQGAGLFNLAAPTVLSGIQTVDLQGAAAGQGQIVWLRDGLDLTLNVQDGAAVKVFGAANNDIINLGSGNAIVYLGSAGETVTGGSGNEAFYVTAASIGASITGGSGTNWLEVTGGGTLTMGGGITGIQAAFLDNAASYDFTANATAGLTVFAGSGSDTITVGDASQTVKGSTGALTVQATAADAGAKVVGGSGGATLEITNGGTATLNAGDNNLTVKLDAATNLNLGGPGFITVIGAAAGGDTIAAGGANQTLVSTGGNDTLIGSAKFGDTFLGSTAGLVGDVIKGFGGSDAIDISDMIAGSVQPLSFNAGTLTVADGTHSVALTFSGSYTAASFAAPASDGHGGTLIRFG